MFAKKWADSKIRDQLTVDSLELPLFACGPHHQQSTVPPPQHPHCDLTPCFAGNKPATRCSLPDLWFLKTKPYLVINKGKKIRKPNFLVLGGWVSANIIPFCSLFFLSFFLQIFWTTENVFLSFYNGFWTIGMVSRPLGVVFSPLLSKQAQKLGRYETKLLNC